VTRPEDSLTIRGQWHSSPDLPRPWIVLPPEVRAAAAAKPLLRHLLPSHVGFFPNARTHRIRREGGIGSTIFKYCVRGAGWCELKGRRANVNAGDLLVVPSGHPHAYGTSEERPWTVHWFHAVGEDVAPLLRQLGVDAEHPVVRLGENTQLVGLFQELFNELSVACSPERLLYGSQLLTHLLGLMIRLRRDAAPEPPDARQRVLACVAHVKNHPEEALDLDALASIVGLSVSHFAALFRAATGDPPGRYLTRVRMERARRSLVGTAHTVKTIAHQLGFDDPLYFSRVFRTENGVSPSEFRRRHRSADPPY
jgi:AraC-like DNA-binding protein